MRTVRAMVDAKGNVCLLEPIDIAVTCKALVTILDDEEPDSALLSEEALARDWLRPEEDEAWAHLQERRSSAK